MRKQKSCKPMLYLLLTGWCLLFLRCESTEKSMVRAVYLSQTGQGYQAGLLYQAPQAAADAAEASAALQFVQAEGQTMEQALAAAEQALPQTASYRLCDYLLLPKAEEPLLTEYEQLVLRRGCGRTAARLLCAEGETGHRAGRHPAALAGRGAHRHPALHRFSHLAKGAGACAAGLSTRCPQPIAHAGAAATACGAVHRTFAKLLAAGRGCAAPASPGSCGAAAAQALTQQKTPARNGGQTCISCCIKRQ